MTTEQEIERYKYITPIVPSAELHGLINAARNKIQLEQPAPFAINFPLSLGDNNLSLAFLLDKKPSERKAIIKKTITDAWLAIKDELDAQFQNLPDLIAYTIIEALFKLLHELVDQLVGPFDDPIIYVQCAYNNVIRLIRKLMDPNLKEEVKQFVIDKLLQLVNELAASIPFVADIIALILLIESMKRVIATLRDMRNASAENYDDSINSINMTLMILDQEALLGSHIISMIVTILKILLPLFALLGAIFCGGKQYDAAVKEVEEKYLEDELKNQEEITSGTSPRRSSIIETHADNDELGFSHSKKNTRKETEESVQEKKEMRLGATLQLTSAEESPFEWKTDFKEIFYTKTDDLGKQPYYYNKDMMKISGYCEISEVTDMGFTYKIATTVPEAEDYCHDEIEYMDMCIDGTSGLGGTDNIADSLNDLEDTESHRAFIEFDPNEEYTINVNAGDTVKYGDNIGTISGVPVYSEKEGIVDYVEENYIALTFADNKDAATVEDDVDSLVTQALTAAGQKTEIDDIIEKFNKLNKVKTILRDYFGYLRLPYIPINDGVEIVDSEHVLSKDFIYGNYKTVLEAKVEAYQDKVQVITGKDHVEKMLNSENMEGLKQEIFKEENAFYSDIISHFRNYVKNNSFVCNTEEKSNFLLLSDYEEIFDKIDYDEENEYLMELVIILENFIITRRAAEGSGKTAYKNAFNNYCDVTLKSKWTFEDTYYDYFEKLYKSYKFETYTTSVNEVKADYKRLYNFLTDLLECTSDSQKTYNVTTMEDIKNLDADATSYVDKDKIKLREEAKKICRRFFLVKDMNEYTEDNSSSSRNRLMTLTASERDIINAYTEKIITTYLDLKDIVNGDCFNSFKRGIVNKRSDVYRNKVLYEHYFVTDSDHIPSFEYDGIQLPDELLDEMNSESSPKTRMPIAKLPYWLLYCMQATLVHCMLPFYWPCGIMIAGAPVPLPVIYIPIYYLSGPVGILFGLAICGVFIFPMIVTVNLTIDVKCMLTFINTILDAIRNNLDMFAENNKTLMKDMIKKRIEELENDSESLTKELQKIDIKISDVEEQIIFCGLQKEEIKERRRQRKAAKKAEKENKKGDE